MEAMYFLPLYCFSTAGEDYQSTTTNFTLDSSTPVLLCVYIPILDDGILEETENFSVILSSMDSNATSAATVSIADNDMEGEFL